MRTANDKPKPPGIGYGSISADEVLPLRECGRRLGWEQKTIRRAQREGLRTIAFGRFKYVFGRDVLRFFDKLAAHPNTNEERQ